MSGVDCMYGQKKRKHQRTKAEAEIQVLAPHFPGGVVTQVKKLHILELFLKSNVHNFAASGRERSVNDSFGARRQESELGGGGGNESPPHHDFVSLNLTNWLNTLLGALAVKIIVKHCQKHKWKRQHFGFSQELKFILKSVCV